MTIKVNTFQYLMCINSDNSRFPINSHNAETTSGTNCVDFMHCLYYKSEFIHTFQFRSRNLLPRIQFSYLFFG